MNTLKKMLCMLLSLCLAGQATAQDLLPGLNLGWQFGAAAAPQWQLRATASQRVQVGPSVVPLPLLAVDFDGRQPPVTSVLGLPLRAAAQQSMVDGEAQASRSSWVWVGLGLGAIAAVAVLAGSGSSEVNNNESSGNSCNGVSGDVIGPNPPSVGSGCTTIVNGGG